MDILAEIREERRRQDAKWGEQNHSPIEWCAILTEEVGEVSKEALELHFAQLQNTGQSEAWFAEKLAALPQGGHSGSRCGIGHGREFGKE
jgi:NTP pyrophosphatase (non-canonical NTP hydrolase)